MGMRNILAHQYGSIDDEIAWLAAHDGRRRSAWRFRRWARATAHNSGCVRQRSTGSRVIPRISTSRGGAQPELCATYRRNLLIVSAASVTVESSIGEVPLVEEGFDPYAQTL
ncbi:MAG: hypothetical protein QM622_10100 [Microbacterium sp.]